MACELHDDMKGNIDRLRNDISELYTRMSCVETEAKMLKERDGFREDSLRRLEDSMEKGQSRLEGLIQALGLQISAIAKELQEVRAAPAKKVAARWDDILGKVLGWVVIAVLTWILSKGGKI